MTHVTRRLSMLIPAALAVPALLRPSAARAQSFPQRTITLVSPWPPGGANDTFSRLIAARLSAAFGQTVMVDNRPGATGTIGVAQVSRASADGYTLVMGSSPTHATALAIYPNLPYHPVRDFAPVTLVATVSNLLAVHPSVPATTVREMSRRASRASSRSDRQGTATRSTFLARCSR